MKSVLIFIFITFSWLIFAGIQRRFSKETLINGFMDSAKAEELASTIFKKDDKASSDKN